MFFFVENIPKTVGGWGIFILLKTRVLTGKKMSSKNWSKSGGNSVVAARPPLFTEVGKQARDLVYKGFVRGHMLVLSCLGPIPGSTITTTATIVDDITVGIISATIQEGNAKHELTFNTLSNKVLLHVCAACSMSVFL